MSETPRMRLPYLAAGQAHKELIHNEALQLLDGLVHILLEENEGRAPPSLPKAGSCYLVPDQATGDWSGKDQSLAVFGDGGWRHIVPFEGLAAIRHRDGVSGIYRNARWNFGELRCSALFTDGQQVVGARSGPIEDPSGGGVVDAEARNALKQILGSLRAHGMIETCEETGLEEGDALCRDSSLSDAFRQQNA